jgi:hypothetical protein
MLGAVRFKLWYQPRDAPAELLITADTKVCNGGLIRFDIPASAGTCCDGRGAFSILVIQKGTITLDGLDEVP